MDYEKVLNVIKNKYIDKDNINWILLIELLKFVPKDKIKFIITFINNPHTQLINNQYALKQDTLQFKQNKDHTLPEGYPTIKETLTTLTITYYSYSSLTPSDIINYAKYVIKSINKLRYKKIIIDLRENGGGNGHAMLLSLAPILPINKIFGYFYIHGKFIPLVFKTINSTLKFFNLTVEKPKKVISEQITVLLGPNTASSGEWMAVCLRSINPKFIGNTIGTYNSINETFETSEGLLALTTGYYADIDKNIYKGSLKATDLNNI